MKGFYDTMLPKEIGKYVKPFGGKVEKSQIGSSKLRIEKDGNSFAVVGEDNTVSGVYDTQSQAQQRIDDLGGSKAATPIWKVSITPEMNKLAQGGQMRFMPEVDLNKLPENVIVPDDIDVGKEVSKGRNSILKEGDSIGTFRYLPEGFIEKFAITDQDREYLKQTKMPVFTIGEGSAYLPKSTKK